VEKTSILQTLNSPYKENILPNCQFCWKVILYIWKLGVSTFWSHMKMMGGRVSNYDSVPPPDHVHWMLASPLWTLLLVLGGWSGEPLNQESIRSIHSLCKQEEAKRRTCSRNSFFCSFSRTACILYAPAHSSLLPSNAYTFVLAIIPCQPFFYNFYRQHSWCLLSDN
jgi:hypothetical protein